MNKQELISIGVVVGTFGNKGELKVKILSDFPELLDLAPNVFIELKTEVVPIEIERIRPHKKFLLVKVKNSNSITNGLQFKGGFISIEKKYRPELEAGEYYHDELIGLEVKTESGRNFGIVKDIHRYGTNEILIISNSGKEHMVPAVDEFVVKVDIESGYLIIRPIKGLLEEDDED